MALIGGPSVPAPPASGAAGAGRRAPSIDAVRGLAVLLMLLDHVCEVFLPHVAAAGLYRVTLGRLAMPLFFLVSGSLVRRLTWRHGLVLVLGLVIPSFVPWIDRPNVLVWYVLGAALLVLARRLRISRVFLVLPALVLYANGWLTAGGNAFQPWACFALMAVGNCFDRDTWSRLRVPLLLRHLGRFPLTVYVGHLAVLTAILWRVS